MRGKGTLSVVIPELRRKLRLLETHGPYAGIDAIAARLGRHPKTILWWADGNAVRQPGTVPKDKARELVDLFVDCLVPAVTPEQAREIVFGPADVMENQLKATTAVPIERHIEEEARSDRIRLHPATDSGFGMIETDLDGAPEGVRLPRGAYFRLVIEKDLRRRHVLALQQAQALWALVPCRTDEVQGHVLVPGVKPDGTLAWMRERRDIGSNRFVVLAAPEPFPAELQQPARQALDRAVLNRLSYFYGRQSRHLREIHAVTVEIE